MSIDDDEHRLELDKDIQWCLNKNNKIVGCWKSKKFYELSDVLADTYLHQRYHGRIKNV